MSKKIIKTIQLNIFLTIIIGVLGFISNKTFNKYMGIETLGLMKLFSQLIAYLSLAELGIGTASTYALYKPLVEKDNKRVDIVVSTIDFFYRRVAFIIFFIGMLLNIAVPSFIQENNYGNLIYIYWTLYVINTAIGYMFAKYSILFTANQEYSFVRKIQGSGTVLFKILQIFVMSYIHSFTIFIIIMILENIYNFYFFNRYYNRNYSWINKVKEVDKGILKDIKNIFWHKIGTLVVMNTDFIVLSKFVSLSLVGIYSSYLMVYQLLITIVNIGTPVITPLIGKFIAENSNDKKKVYNYWEKIYSLYMFISTIAIFCSYVLINPFMELWLGKNYILSQFSVILILINLFIHMTRVPIGIFKGSSGFFDDIYSPILESTINLVVSLILVRKLGLNGVVIGTLSSNIVVILFLQPILTFRKCFNKSCFDYIKIFLKNISLSLGVFYLLNLFFKKLNLFSKLDSWSSFILNGVLIGILAVIFSFVVFSTNKDFRGIVFKVIKNKK